MESKFNITAPESGELIIRHGDAPTVYDPNPLVISGQISAPGRFYNARKALLNGLYFAIGITHVIVDRAKGYMELVRDESSKFATRITGILEISPEFIDLKINTGSPYSPLDLAKKLKSVRWMFPSMEEAAKVISELSKFSATVTAQVENHKDDRGGKKTLSEIAVSSNIPESFLIKIPIFKGYLPQDLRIEINIDTRANTVECYLESPEATDIIGRTKNSIFDTELQPFFQDGIPVIEI